MELKKIRQGIADSLTAVLDPSAMQISPYMLASPTPPAAHVFPGDQQFHQAMGDGAETWGLIVEVLVGMVNDQGAQILLDSYLDSDGPTSVKLAIEAAALPNGTLYGVVASRGVTVTSTTGYRQYQLGGTQGLALGAQWNVSILV